MSTNFRIPVEKLRRHCRPDELSCETSAEVTPLNDFIGQERAVKAMQFGLSMTAPGYNIYVSGPTGTGKSTYTKAVLQHYSALSPVPNDWCFLYNFNNPDQPVSISLPVGKGLALQKDMDEFVTDLWATIPKAFEGEDYEQKKQALLKVLEENIERKLEALRQEAADLGFKMNQTSDGFVFLPLIDGKRMTSETFEALPSEERQNLEKRGRHLQHKLEDTINESKTMEKEAQKHIGELDEQIVFLAAGPLIQRLADKYQEYPKVTRFLNEVQEDITKNLGQFKPSEPTQTAAAAFNGTDQLTVTDRYKINLFVNHSETKGAPVIFETSPNHYNLFGKIEYRSQLGTMNTDFTMIKAGAIHQANGGYLVLQARDLLADQSVWETLKRALKNKQTVIENIGEQYRMVPTASLRPESIPLDLKVILIGNPQTYHVLLAHDEDFKKFFKVKVDFDTEMPRTKENLAHYTAFVGSVCSREKLKHFDRTGLAELIEYGSRLAGDQNKLSTCFNEVIEIVYEAAAWAETEGTDFVGAPHVLKAIDERIYRCNRIEEKIQEMMSQGKILVDTSGSVVGQINGLSVLDIGDYVFGRPSRITAKTFMGREGVVNIEREIHLSGSIHTKGVLTLAGFLGDRFAQDKPLRLSARLTFEQLYEGVDGDSASSAELYAILSSLSGLPIKQNLAVTGSVNQHGQIQPIGGVTEKIEGFFEVCKVRGLTGDQGVLIPVQNIDNLMLKHEVVQAVAEGKFHVYAVSTIEEGLELLTGVPAGAKDRTRNYPEGTVFRLANDKLVRYAQGLSQFDHVSAAKEQPCQKDCCS